MDAIYLGLTLGFFAATVGLLHLRSALRRGGSR
jgi:hypothetical protein